MNPSDETVTPTDDEIELHVEAFWRQAVFKARINNMPSYFGPTPLESVRPPAWSWGEDDAEADAFVEDIVSGTTTGLAVPAAEFSDEEPPPEIGEMGIVLDGGTQPRALILTTEVVTLAVGDLDLASTVVAGGDQPPETSMVLQRLRVLYSV